MTPIIRPADPARPAGARRLPCLACMIVALLLGAAGSEAQTLGTPQDPAAPQAPEFRETVEVVGATPLHGVGIRLDRVPGNVQVATSADLARTGGIHVGEQLATTFASVHVNEAQENPFQPDIQFRGFTASPLLGLPMGLAIYQDGVRMNEPFGDTVNWDLLPANAIASVNLMPGSSPLFGLNALGGAISMQTKNGFSHPGHAVSVWGGSFRRRWADVQSAGSSGQFSYFVTGRLLAEDGWRDFSPSRLRQMFGNVEWRGSATTISGSVSGGNNKLIGNGAAPAPLLEIDRGAVFTHPDETKTSATLLSLRGSHVAARDVSIDVVGFYRPATVSTFNGDDTDYDGCEDDDLDGLLCSDDGDGEPVRDQRGRFVEADDDDPLSGTNNTSRTRTHGWGGSVQATSTRALRGRDNHFVAGVSFEGAQSRYESATELARLTKDRGTVGSGRFDSEAAVGVHTRVRHVGAFVGDFFTVAPRLTLMGAARLTHSTVELRDQLGDDLDGDHAFTRLNPSGGLTYALPRGISLYGSLSISSRVPTPSELSCADPEDPCRLPNAFVADPPLEEVVARTWEGGARGRTPGLGWSAAVFHTQNQDDIIFISSGALTNQGHFANVGETSRRGLELSVFAGARAGVRWGTSYTLLQAQFDTPLTLPSPNHPEDVDGEIPVEAGSRLPGVPRHNFKADVGVTLGRVTLDANVLSTSSQFVRGDEANLLAPLDASTVVNLSGGVALHRHARLVARISNLFDQKSATFGLLGEADDVLGDDFDEPLFLSPRAPRAAWVGIELTLP